MRRLIQIILNYSTPQHYYLQNSIKGFAKKCGAVHRLVDIGCAYSPFGEMFSAVNHVLVDVEKRGDANILSDVQHLAFKDDCANLVLLTEVLEHVTDENKALSEIYRVLHPGGWLIISVPFLFGIHETVDYRRWTDHGLKTLLQGHGFNIVDFQSQGAAFSAILHLYRDLPRQVLGGDFQSLTARCLFPLIGLHFLTCLLLSPVAILLDNLDKKRLSTTGYVVLCQKKAQG